MQDRPPDLSGQWPQTQWSLVARAAHIDAALKRQALGDLLTRYRSALLAHLVRRKGLRLERAEDLLHEFLASKILDDGIIERAQREKGRFRNFLRVALDRFLVSQYRRDSAAKRAPDSGGVASLAEDGDLARSPEAAPDSTLDIAWAKQVVLEALKRMKEDCLARGRDDMWAVFEARILAPAFDGADETSYDNLIARFGFDSPRAASNVLMNAKRAYERALRSVIAEYEPDSADIDSEIEDLRSLMAGGV
jgi:RNA polymerase sigma-70 factor (ECF subfamily)